jgi:hypothetical protein
LRGQELRKAAGENRDQVIEGDAAGKETLRCKRVHASVMPSQSRGTSLLGWGLPFVFGSWRDAPAVTGASVVQPKRSGRRGRFSIVVGVGREGLGPEVRLAEAWFQFECVHDDIECRVTACVRERTS